MCPICSSARDHGLLDCPTYAGLAGPSRQFLESVWETFGHSGLPTQSWRIYRLCYSGELVSWAETWGTCFGITERLYLSVLPVHLMNVWTSIKPLFPQVHGCKMAKRCAVEEAHKRDDTIVVYFGGSPSRNSFVERLRTMHQPQPGRGNAPSVAARLRADMFSDRVPGLTSSVSGLRGVSLARDPGPSLSFGEHISNIAADAFNAEHDNREAFIGQAIQAFALAGIDLRRPWA